MEKKKPRLWVSLLKIFMPMILLPLFLPPGILLVHYGIGRIFYGWDPNAHQKGEWLNADNFFKPALLDVTPKPMRDQVTIGDDGPFFLFLKVNRGDAPKFGDVQPDGQRYRVELTVYQGFGTLHPIREKKGLWDRLTLSRECVYDTDKFGQVMAVFYPSIFRKTYLGNFFTRGIGNDIVITARVLDDPRITNEVTYEWSPVELRGEDFDRAKEAFVSWHNRIRSIDRTERMVQIDGYVDQATGQFVGHPSDQQAQETVYEGGKGTSHGQEIPNEPYDAGIFDKVGRVPWGYMGKDVVFCSRGYENSVQLWAYDPDTGLMDEKLRFPELSGWGGQEDRREYQRINGNYFPSYDRFRTFYGQVVSYASEISTTVTLAH